MCKRLIFTVVLVCGLFGCAGLGSSAKVVGVWEGSSSEYIVNDNGTYSMSGKIADYTVGQSGKWQMSGKEVIFQPKKVYGNELTEHALYDEDTDSLRIYFSIDGRSDAKYFNSFTRRH